MITMSVTAFSSSDDVIERKVQCSGEATTEKELDCVYEIPRCVTWIQDGFYTKVALQFPDQLLVDAPQVALRLQESIPEAFVFILGDTSYGSCCVDEVGADHYKADCVIHFGHACLSPTARLPVLYVFGRSPVNLEDSISQINSHFSDSSTQAVLVYDTCYLYIVNEMFERLKVHLPALILSQLHVPGNVATSSLNVTESALSKEDSDVKSGSENVVCKCGRIVNLPDGHKIEDYTFIFVGDTNGPSLINMMMTFNKCPFYSYNPLTSKCSRESVNINRSLMKRFYLIERVKDANIVGIVAGTLGVARYREMIEHMKSLLKRAGKKSYTFVVGKLNPAKLANFAEIEVFVLVSCPESCLLEQSEFYSPVVSPFEVEVALNEAQEWTGDYSMDFREFLPGGNMHIPTPEELSVNENADVSLISNKARVLGPREESRPESAGQEVVLRSDALTVSTVAENAAEYLASRSWQGLEQKLGETPVMKASEGIRGIAASYDHEMDYKSS